MPAPDDSAVVRDRLAALRLEPQGWVPDQSGLSFASAPAAEQPTRPVVPAPTRRPPHAWWESVAFAGSNRAVLGLAAVCAACLLLTGWTLFRHHHAVAVPPPVAASVPITPLPQTSPAGIVVDVGGRVRRPGLVTLPPGSRVADAIRAAGGVVRPADLALVNLAAKVSDGELLLIGVPGAAPDGSGVAGSGGPVNLNTATADELDALPGIGPVLAQRIIDWRTAHGGFASVKDLDQVSGIGASIFAEISSLVAV